MNGLVPGEKKFLNMLDGTDWSSTELNWRAKVVCEPCNNGWMSNIESQHAKPAMTDLIGGKLDIPIPQSHANSIALFAFKTTIVLEHLSRRRAGRFFPREVRNGFRQTLTIPPNVRMWLTGYLPCGQGRCTTIYHALPDPGSLELYVCTYAIGRFAFQVVAERKPSPFTLSPVAGFEHMAVPFWPRIPIGFMWPPKAVLESVKDYDLFASRWRRLNIQRPLG
jgi:hypothetical protein